MSIIFFLIMLKAWSEGIELIDAALYVMALLYIGDAVIVGSKIRSNKD